MQRCINYPQLIRPRIPVVWFLALTVLGPITGANDQPSSHFDTAVATVLARRCLECHNGTEPEGDLDLAGRESAMRGGESGAAILPGDAEGSLLWQRVEGDEMPPKEPLSREEKAVLYDWINNKNAEWGTDPIDPFRFTTEARAGYDWWALQPLRDVNPPRLSSSTSANPIDQFIATKLTDAGLKPVAPASRRTLIRRLSFDLLGLPPASAAVRAFVEDPSPYAYEELVDRTLASPRYGERWARHWLDVVRFGESQGFERDKLRSNSWRYRDWVIDALNRDVPYDEFVRLQLAGDVLEPNDPMAVIATGFLVAGPYDEVGQSQQSEAMKAVVRQDELEDMVSAVCQTLLGLTVNCARCHDHKFDPVTQVEYYQLAAALSGVRHGQRTIDDKSLVEANDLAIRSTGARIVRLETKLASLDGPIRERILAARRKQPTPRPTPIASWGFSSGFEDSIGAMHATPRDGARIENGLLELDGKSFAATEPVTRDIREKTLEAWVQLRDLDQRGGGVISLQTLDGSVFDAIVFGEREARRWMAGSDGFARTRSFGGEQESDTGKAVHVAVTYQSDGTITAYHNGQPYGKPYKSSGPVEFKAGTYQVIFGLRHGPPGGNRFLSGAVDRAQLYDRALSPPEVAASAGVLYSVVSDEEISERLTATQRTMRDRLRFEISQLRSQQTRYREKAVYAVTPRQPEVTHLLLRGNTTQPSSVVAPGGVSSIGADAAEFGLDPDAPDAERRVKLASWISDRNNPLFARVIVNRIWHYHFGVGLVETPNDLGFNGGRPSHSELLDWLAGELIRRDWSVKSLQRTIVTSAAYKRASTIDSVAMNRDADNRLLWRQSPRRLEAEAIRDTILAVSGELNPTMNGPGYHDFRTFTFNSQFYEMFDPQGVAFQRRSIYRTWVRSGRNAFLDVFDCPDPSAKAPTRAVTTTPLQALSLLNNSFVFRMADHLAARIEGEGLRDTGDQVAQVYQRVFAREPSASERSLATAFVEKHELAAFCRVIFNSNEFLYVD